MRAFRHIRQNKVLLWPNWALAVIALFLAGTVYRVAASRLKLVTETPMVLPVSLSVFPAEIRDWTGKDVPISRNIQRVAGNDDFLNRLYINKSKGQWANVYVAYTARPRTMLGHSPQVCYVSGGYVHDSTEPAEVVSLSGRTIPCLIHRFHKPAPQIDEIVVLNFYILNGQLARSDRGFSGIGWRSPNIEGDAARYVTQVQLVSILENSVRLAAKDMADLILDFFPDENNKVRAVEYIKPKDNAAEDIDINTVD